MLTSMYSFFKAIAQGIRQPEYQLLALTSSFVMVGGTMFYHFYEDWSWIESIYFVVVALTTVGFGDLTPTTEFSRAITIGFLFFGVAWIGALISILVKSAQERHQAKLEAKQEDDS